MIRINIFLLLKHSNSYFYLTFLPCCMLEGATMDHRASPTVSSSSYTDSTPSDQHLDVGVESCRTSHMSSESSNNTQSEDGHLRAAHQPDKPEHTLQRQEHVITVMSNEQLKIHLKGDTVRHVTGKVKWLCGTLP